jgi:hypothetical protein
MTCHSCQFAHALGEAYAAGGTRTRTSFRTMAFEAIVSTDSTTAAHGGV